MAEPQPDADRAKPFEGFPPAAFAFLRDLAETQDRAWFELNKGRYVADVQSPMVALVAELGAELSRREIPLQGDPRRSMFRIHRDVRFSRDKRPYKTHIGAVLSRDGGKVSPGVLYVHIDPEDSFIAAGFYRPEADDLQRIREALVSRRPAFRRAMEGFAGAGLALEPDADALKRPPRGFESATEPGLLDLLRRKSFILRCALAPEAVRDPALVGAIADFGEVVLPLLRFGWSAIDSRLA